jgi:hypothetical protein
MDTDLRRADVPRLVVALADVTDRVEQHFGGLDAEQLNRKPAPAEWSVGQCLDHLIVTNRTYRPIIERIRSGLYQPGFWQRLPVVPGLVGTMFYTMLHPDTVIKVPSPPAFRPSNSAISADIVARFSTEQAELITLMQDCAELPGETIIIPSPASDLISYSLFDAFRIMTVHEQLHLGQALRAWETLQP